MRRVMRARGSHLACLTFAMCPRQIRKLPQPPLPASGRSTSTNTSHHHPRHLIIVIIIIIILIMTNPRGETSCAALGGAWRSTSNLGDAPSASPSALCAGRRADGLSKPCEQRTALTASRTARERSVQDPRPWWRTVLDDASHNRRVPTQGVIRPLRTARPSMRARRREGLTECDLINTIRVGRVGVVDKSSIDQHHVSISQASWFSIGRLVPPFLNHQHFNFPPFPPRGLGEQPLGGRHLGEARWIP